MNSEEYRDIIKEQLANSKDDIFKMFKQVK